MKDLQGNSYLLASEAKAGLEIWLDEDFTCQRPGKQVLQSDANGELFFPCDYGQHYIDGQLSGGEEGVPLYYVGIYASAPKESA